MSALQAIRTGWQVVQRRKGAVVLYWAMHTLLALAAAIPLAGVGISMVAKTKYGDELFRDFDVMFLMEAAARAGRVDWAVFLAAMLLPLLVVGAAYLSGGAFHVLSNNAAAYSQALFWEGAGLYFWRFLRVTAYSPLAWLPCLAAGLAMTKATEKIWGEGMEAAPIYYAGHARTVLMALLAGYALAVVDFTRARIAAENSRKVFRNLLRAMWFAARRPFLALGPWAALSAVFLLLSWLYLKFANLLPGGVTPLVILWIVFQQAYVLARVALRFTGWAAILAIDAAARGEHHEPKQEVLPHVIGGGDGGLRAGDEASPEAEGPQAG